MRGSFKALFPRNPEPHLDAVVLNTAGGVTGGDDYTLEMSLKRGAHMRATSQACERLYAAQPDETGAISIRAELQANARLDWIPQETLVFNHARARRRIEIDMAEDAACIVVEPIVFGRAAMGESVTSGSLHDSWRIRRAGRLLFADEMRMSGDLEQLLARPAIARNDRAAASLMLAAPHAEDRLEQLQRLIAPFGGASAPRPGVLFARLTASDGFALRQALIPAIEFLGEMPIPKVWRL